MTESESICVCASSRYLNSRKGRDLGAGSDEDVLGVDDLLAAVGRHGRHLVLSRHLAEAVDVGHLPGEDAASAGLTRAEG